VNLPVALPDIELHHGQAVWVLEQLGFRANASNSTFYEYVKSLRKLGIPFALGQLGYIPRGLANYSYNIVILWSLHSHASCGSITSFPIQWLGSLSSTGLEYLLLKICSKRVKFCLKL
jgi:hypothetical protein